MAKEMTRTIEADIANLDKSVNMMCDELHHVKIVTHNLCTMMIQILHELSHILDHSSATPHNHPPKDAIGIMQPTLEQLDKDRSMHGRGSR